MPAFCKSVASDFSTQALVFGIAPGVADEALGRGDFLLRDIRLQAEKDLLESRTPVGGPAVCAHDPGLLLGELDRFLGARDRHLLAALAAEREARAFGELVSNHRAVKGMPVRTHCRLQTTQRHVAAVQKALE